MNTFLRNICTFLFLIFPLCSCALLPDIPNVPEVKDKPFPKNVSYILWGGGGGAMSIACLRGDYVGQRIENTYLARANSWQQEPDRPDPVGKGKIHMRYTKDQNEYTTFGNIKVLEEWGYTFTIYTTEDGIITKCLATQQLLYRR